MAPDPHRPPRRAVVVGAGVVGLSCAWFLQSAGVEVVVVERDRPAAGSSWGNAGWVSPGLVSPLPEPSVLRYGLRALLDPSSALRIPLRLDPALWAFLARFARHCSARRWTQALEDYREIDSRALGAYQLLAACGVRVGTVDSPILAAFSERSHASGLCRELAVLRAAGLPAETTELDGDAARSLHPQVSDRVGYALAILGQRYVDPGGLVDALAESFSGRGGELLNGWEATGVRSGHGGVEVLGVGVSGAERRVRADVAVLATGAWIGRLAAPLGVRVAVRAGRGYSFSVETAGEVPGPLYLPVPRVACTPYRSRLRVGGTMELRPPDAPLDRARVRALVASARPLLTGVDWDSIDEVWVGSRPITPDGLPLIGRTADPAVFVAGGHGMWGVTLGPATGSMLAEQITTGRAPPGMGAFDPLR